MNIRFEAQNVRGFYRAGSVEIVENDLLKYNLPTGSKRCQMRQQQKLDSR